MTLVHRLFVLVAVALLPAIAIQIYNEFDLRRERQSEVQNHALRLAQLTAAEQQQIVQGIRQVLIALSELPSIKTEDSVACNAYLAAMQQRFPAFLSFLVADLAGRSFCDTNSDHRPIDISARAYFDSVLKTGAFTVGEFSTGLSSRRNVIQFALPFADNNGLMGGVIVAGLSLDWLADYVARKGAPAGAALAITDRNGTYLARYPDNGRFVGRKMPDVKALSLDDQNTVALRDVDGVERLVGYSAIHPGSGGLQVSFGIDKVRAFAAIQHRTQRDILLMVAGTTLVLVLTWFGARRFIHRPLGQLVEAANQWGLGDYSRRVKMQEQSEIGRVADAFNSMADALQHRERDLSEAKQKAEEAVARLTTIFESTTDSVLIVDRDWRITYLNQRAIAQVADGRELIGMTLEDAFLQADHADLFSQLRLAVAEQRPISFEVFCARREIWYAVNAFPSDQGVAIYFRDVTEHKRSIETRRLMEEQLSQSQKMEAVGQLTGGIAHDFNNLLTVVSSNLELIDRSAGDSERVRRLASAARHAADRGAELTAQLLAFSRRQRLNPKLVCPGQLIGEFQGLIRQAVGEGCEVQVMTGEQLWPCHVNSAQLQTAVLNLALNGRDAMPDGGVLTIEMRNVFLAEGELPGCLPGSYVRLAVTDTGCGMPPDVRERAVEPFFTTKEVGKGTGLGLSMVYGFVEQSGGHLMIDSAVGAGTSVALYLPRTTQRPDAAGEAIQNYAPAGSERILIVEDHEGLLEVTSDMLMDLGYRVICARNGREAVQILENVQDIDLLFSDVVMPSGMNGIELAREARRLRPGIKVLLASGYAEEVLERHGAGDELAVIGKPFHRTDLAQRLRSILRDRSGSPSKP